MREIQLTQGKVALVDDEDFEALNRWNWQVQISPRSSYAIRTVYVAGKKNTLRMHRALLNAANGAEVDHVDSNGLNNQRYNLRLVTRKQNTQNMRKGLPITASKFKGVCWNPKKARWVARISYYGRRHHLGNFKREVDAAHAYDEAARRMYGEFACVNIPREGERPCCEVT